MVVPTILASFLKPFKGDLELQDNDDKPTNKYSSTMLFLGLGAIVFVPFFKVITHLPPYVGMMLSLAVVATFAEIFSRRKFSLIDFNPMCKDIDCGDLNMIRSPVILKYLDQFL